MSDLSIESAPLGVETTTPHEKPWFVRLLLVPVLALGVILVGGLVWGLAGFLLNQVYFIGAILIGFAVTAALLVPFKRTTLLLAILMFLPAVALTIITVLFGDYVLLVLTAMRELQIGLGEAAAEIASQFVELEMASGGQMSFVFALVGSVISFIYMVRNPDN